MSDPPSVGDIVDIQSPTMHLLSVMTSLSTSRLSENGAFDQQRYTSGQARIFSNILEERLEGALDRIEGTLSLVQLGLTNLPRRPHHRVKHVSGLK